MMEKIHTFFTAFGHPIVYLWLQFPAVMAVPWLNRRPKFAVHAANVVLGRCLEKVGGLWMYYNLML